MHAIIRSFVFLPPSSLYVPSLHRGYRDERLIAACKLNWPLVIKWIAAVMMKKKHSIVSRYFVA